MYSAAAPNGQAWTNFGCGVENVNEFRQSCLHDHDLFFDIWCTARKRGTESKWCLKAAYSDEGESLKRGSRSLGTDSARAGIEMHAMDAYVCGLGWAVSHLGVLDVLQVAARRNDTSAFASTAGVMSQDAPSTDVQGKPRPWQKLGSTRTTSHVLSAESNSGQGVALGCRFVESFVLTHLLTEIGSPFLTRHIFFGRNGWREQDWVRLA